MKSAIRIIQWGLVGIAGWGVYGLIEKEMAVGNICPKVFDIPACYVIAGCLAAIALAFFFRKLETLFYLGSWIALGLAGSASFYQYKGMSECPKTADGTPMCYISLGIFLGILILHYFHGKIKK